MSGALEAALQLAAHGFPVFPCQRNKRPALQGRGFHDATTDDTQIRTMFAAAGDLVGCPTGSITGFDVLDLDYRNGAIEWQDANLHRIPETRIHRTQSGGRHFLFRHAPGVRNTAGKIAPGIDVRGDGGYVIMPPSAGYEIVSDADIAEWPDWLLDLVLSQPLPPRANGYHFEPISSQRLDGFVRSVCGRVEAAGEGAKHFALRNAALSLGGIQQAAGLSDAQATDMLRAALPRSVKDWKNAERTIAWGLAHGRNRPIEFENRERSADRGKIHSAADYPSAEPEAEQPEIGKQQFDPDLFPVEYFHDIAAPTDTQDFVEQLLISATMCVVYGESNSGKTFFATDLFLHVACGWDWNGRQVERGAVIYCALEGAHGIRNRVVAFRDEHGLGSHEIPFAVIAVAMDLLKPDADVGKLIATIQHEAKKLGVPVRAVVLDTLSRAMAGGNENAPDDMGQLVANGTRIQQATGALVCWIHHSGKDVARGARGHSLLRAATETEIEIVDNGGLRTAVVTKQRELECVGTFVFRLKPVEIGTDRRGKAITSCVVAPEEAPGQIATRRDSKLPDGASLAMRALVGAMSRSGARLPPTSEYPGNTIAVAASMWREEFYQLKSGTLDAKKHAFSRAEDVLLARNLITQRNGLVWIVSRDTQTGQTGQNGS